MATVTLEELVAKYPSLRDRELTEDFNQTLAACGYRFTELEDIIRARNCGYDELKACRVVEIICCL